jgi:uncharacterized membrane protein YhaH (DUF805 family)
MNWYMTVLQRYADFSGRAMRIEYWMFFLFNFLIAFAIGFVFGLAGLPDVANVLGLIYSLAVLIPGIAVGVRRLHDTNRSGWWLLIGLIPIIGAVVLIIFFVQDSGADNQYGPNPKGVTSAGFA